MISFKLILQLFISNNVKKQLKKQKANKTNKTTKNKNNNRITK